MTTSVIRNISVQISRRTSTSNGARDLSRMTSFSSNSPSVITMTYKNNEWTRSNTGYTHTHIVVLSLSLLLLLLKPTAVAGIVCLSVYLHNVSKTDTARITKLDIPNDSNVP